MAHTTVTTRHSALTQLEVMNVLATLDMKEMEQTVQVCH